MAGPATGGAPYGLITSLWQLRGREGNKNMITAAAILKNGEKRKEAERFMEYLFSREALLIMREYRMIPMADALNDRNKYGDIGIVPNDDLRWMAGEKQVLIREWINAK